MSSDGSFTSGADGYGQGNGEKFPVAYPAVRTRRSAYTLKY